MGHLDTGLSYLVGLDQVLDDSVHRSGWYDPPGLAVSGRFQALIPHTCSVPITYSCNQLTHPLVHNSDG